MPTSQENRAPHDAGDEQQQQALSSRTRTFSSGSTLAAFYGNSRVRAPSHVASSNMNVDQQRKQDPQASNGQMEEPSHNAGHHQRGDGYQQKNHKAHHHQHQNQPHPMSFLERQNLHTILDMSSSLNEDSSERHMSTRFHFNGATNDSLKYSGFSSSSIPDPAGLALIDHKSPRRDVPLGGDYGSIPPNHASGQSRQLGPQAAPQQQFDIANFAKMALADYSSMGVSPTHLQMHNSSPTLLSGWRDSKDSDSDDDDDRNDLSPLGFGSEDSTTTTSNVSSYGSQGLFSCLLSLLDPTEWLLRDAKENHNGDLYFESTNWTVAAGVRHFLFDPLTPEFTSLQQFCWAVIIGVLMGFYTAGWKYIIESGIDFVWETIPILLLRAGLFTDLAGSFPLYHYMWICPAIFGAILSYIFAVLPFKIPDQNEWINSVHSKGVQESSTFGTLFVLSTLGMLSGLSLGPELPLVLTAGMVGSWFGLLCKQSILQARVLNLTAASAAVGGFFGFPMAGALFVLELPHRMGLQYFEALSPATISSIAAVLCNRMITGNDVTGYFKYPFLTSTLPSEVFTCSIVYGLFGAAIGLVYAASAIKLKKWVHDLFHAPHHDHAAEVEEEKDGSLDEEKAPLMYVPPAKPKSPPSFKAFRLYIKDEPIRAAVAGAIAGAAVGIIGMFVPHTMFWGEAQLQNLIDKGRTPLPVFGTGDEPTAAMVALGRCMVDPDDPVGINKNGFNIGCSLLITVSKIAVVGLSLGTGIIGGHFWGPLFVGCSMSHFLTDLVNWFADHFGFGRQLAAYPCLVILCTMGSAHVVTFRAHMAIMLILTLTISAFDPADGGSSFAVAGDYSAVFPLLVVSVFVSLMASRWFVFYKEQRSRGDITAVPEALCEPGMEGRPMVIDYEGRSEDLSSEDNPYDEYDSDRNGEPNVRTIEEKITQSDIEVAFEKQNSAEATARDEPAEESPQSTVDTERVDAFANSAPKISPDAAPSLSSARLDELLGKTIESRPPQQPRRHRRTQSAPVVPRDQPVEKSTSVSSNSSIQSQAEGTRGRRNSGSGMLVRISSFGEINEEQPSLLDQARMRSASSAIESKHRRVSSIGDSRHRRHPSLPSGRHSRKNSDASFGSFQGGGALSIEDIEQTFNYVANKQVKDNSFQNRLWTENNDSP